MSAEAAVLESREIDDLLLQARGLVLVRKLLAERGAGQDELGCANHRSVAEKA